MCEHHCRIFDVCETGETEREGRQLASRGGVAVPSGTGHAPHQLLRHRQTHQNQNLCPGVCRHDTNSGNLINI